MTSAEIKLLLSTPLDDDTKAMARLIDQGFLQLSDVTGDCYILTRKGDDLVGVILQVARLASA